MTSHSLTLTVVALCCLAGSAVAQRGGNYVEEYYDEGPRQAPQHHSRPQAPPAPRPTPIAILKQINRHNEDGSYTYGYEGGDGSFKIETKLPTGEVMGKYGYVDDSGKVRVVEYGANKYGFQPAGEGITVAPPTLVDETTDKKGAVIVDDGQYYEEERPRAKAQPRPAPQPQYRPAPQAPQPQYRPAPQAPQPQYRPAPQFAPAPAPRPQPAPQRVEYVQEFVGQSPASRPHGVPQFKSAPSSGPTPPRAVVPGAAPVFQPAPVYEEPRPAPQRLPVPQAAPRPRAPSYGRSSSGILDQLERDYALPQGAAATHDISFGSY